MPSRKTSLSLGTPKAFKNPGTNEGVPFETAPAWVLG